MIRTQRGIDSTAAATSPPDRGHGQRRWPRRAPLALLLSALSACTTFGRTVDELTIRYDMPVEILAPIAAAGIDDRQQEFADLFCSVLEEMDEFDEWGPCERYWRSRGRTDVELGPIPTRYRVLSISGIFAQCVANRLRGFENGLTRLREIHGLDAQSLDVTAFGSSAQNGRIIAAYLNRNTTTSESRPYILVAHSKGAPDIFEGIVNDPDAREKVAAVITVAGAIGGSPVVDALQGDGITKLVAHFGGEANCDVGDEGGFQSLHRQTRHRFLAAQAWPIVPAYSIVGIVDLDNTSLINRPTWRLLALHAKESDGQVLAREAIVPRATFLGAANADHWALAMPFDTLQDDELERDFITHNEFPREAMLEAAVRFVIADLESAELATARQP